MVFPTDDRWAVDDRPKDRVDRFVMQLGKLQASARTRSPAAQVSVVQACRERPQMDCVDVGRPFVVSDVGLAESRWHAS